jgi:hypothetical protein
VKEFGADPQHAFPGIERLRREVQKLKAERDFLQKPSRPLPACAR